MQRRLVLAQIARIGQITLFAAALAGCAALTPDSGWVSLLDGGKGLAENFDRVGDANWRTVDGLVVADKGKGGFLVSKASYKDFLLRAEFWAETDTNSGLFLRLSDPLKITADNSYEVNIWDIRPDPKYGTGGIVGFAAVPVPVVHKAGGRWNSYEIEARGAQLTVRLNGVVTTTLQNDKFASGPLALQYGAGVQGATGGPIKWRKVAIKPL
ncbi:conserved exported hypothetical protein [Rubrivivax sp. A210]|uniref:3-keto-disaccharide hydrolase n=1 Tax=Rubrivivax sp. A210 TaxID=2772301 RepID=UPI001917E11C|nr:DUF1080 domain-containing protein [Rubrivivax sp. A210]CAD5374528.1 conserved exported hypothetical protein [Rubrivivax sp. A210]